MSVPPNTELLAFEGEIALIIGKPARRVSVEEAWDHVGQVTASNDLGVYDIKYADKGSNIRSKSGDGFTPIGPALLPAASVNPDALRIRTWVNGEVVQDDTTAGLIFSFARIVADLSQLMTLHPGDVILTGTPAGSSVIVPGDVVEVEVSDEAAGLSTGRLSTTVTQGEAEFASFGNTPKVTDQDRVDAFGSEEAAGLAPAVTGKSALTDEVKAKLLSVATATISGAAAQARAEQRQRSTACWPPSPARRSSARRARCASCPTARTCSSPTVAATTPRSASSTPSARARSSSWRPAARRARARSATSSPCAPRCAARQAIITDGGVRDLSEPWRRWGSRRSINGAHPAVLGRKHVPWDTDVTIACGGTTIQPGDIIVADDNGILVIPPALAAEIADEVVEQERQDTFVFEHGQGRQHDRRACSR